MKNVVWALLIILALAMGILIISCGEVDPALAPAGAIIELVGSSENAWEYSCNYKVPYPCLEELESYLVAACKVEDWPNLPEGPERDAECEGRLWKQGLANDKYLNNFRDEIALEVGSCGSLNNIVTAFAYLPASTGSTTGATGENAGTSLTGEVLNDIEVRFIAVNGEMYRLSDISGAVPPLANPYLTRTDDRGKAELKYLTQFPTVCGSTTTYILSADLGVSKTEMSITFTVTAETEEEATDDDDSVE